MEIKYKLYPYPVLSSYSDDYKTGSFDATIDVVRDGYNYRLDFLATLTCQSLLERIKNGDAKYRKYSFHTLRTRTFRSFAEFTNCSAPTLWRRYFWIHYSALEFQEIKNACSSLRPELANDC